MASPAAFQTRRTWTQVVTRGGDQNNESTFYRKNTKEHWMARLDRDHPDLAAQVDAGLMTRVKLRPNLKPRRPSRGNIETAIDTIVDGCAEMAILHNPFKGVVPELDLLFRIII